MTGATQYLDRLYSFAQLSQARQRRQSLIDRMQVLETEKLHCFECSGTCCTFVSNSMQIDPLETLELYTSLNVTNDLIEKWQKTVDNFRLNYDVFSLKGKSFRRTYTCPFFAGSALGCTLSRGVKPYGCLGFNPKKQGVTEGGDCSSAQDLLLKRSEEFKAVEDVAIEKIKKDFNITWEKKTIPTALLEIHSFFTKHH